MSHLLLEHNMTCCYQLRNVRRQMKRLVQIGFLLAIAFVLGNVLNKRRQNASITTAKGKLGNVSN